MHMPTHAAVKRDPSHIVVVPPGLTAEPDSDYPHEHPGGKVDAMVTVNVNHHPNIVVPLSTSNYPGFEPEVHYYKDDGSEHTGLCGEEGIAVVTKLLHSGMHATIDAHAVLVLDRGPAYTSNIFQDFCKRNYVDLLFLPSHSPDLSPLDSNLFGVAKQRYEAAYSQGDEWGARAHGFITILEETDSAPHISRWQQRVEAVVEANGYHIEELLAEAKRKEKKKA